MSEPVRISIDDVTEAARELARLRGEVQTLLAVNDHVAEVQVELHRAGFEPGADGSLLVPVRRLLAERDAAIRAFESCRAEHDRVAARLEEARDAMIGSVQQPGVDDGNPCWCSLSSMVPYRGHDAGCEAVRAWLAAGTKASGEGA